MPIFEHFIYLNNFIYFSYKIALLKPRSNLCISTPETNLLCLLSSQISGGIYLDMI